MKSEPFNPVQLHLLKMFSYAKDERALEDRFHQKQERLSSMHRLSQSLYREGELFVLLSHG